jgi:hypothetical protein
MQTGRVVWYLVTFKTILLSRNWPTDIPASRRQAKSVGSWNLRWHSNVFPAPDTRFSCRFPAATFNIQRKISQQRRKTNHNGFAAPLFTRSEHESLQKQWKH